MCIVRVSATAVVLVLAAGAAAGQTSRPASAFEIHGGYAAFADESPVQHAIGGAAYRFHLSPRVSVGPELIYMSGPGEDRDIFLTGDVWFDFVAPSPSGVKRVVPYLVAGGGVMFHRNFLYNEGTKWFAREPAFTGGFGVRIPLGERWYVAPEARLGWEMHIRFSAAVGYRFR